MLFASISVYIFNNLGEAVAPADGDRARGSCPRAIPERPRALYIILDQSLAFVRWADK